MSESLDGAVRVNPTLFKGQSRKLIIVVKDASLAVNAGQLGLYGTDGEAEEFATNGTKVNLLFAETETAAAGSTRAYEIDSSTILVFSVVDGTSDTAATRTMLGELHSIRVISNICCMDIAGSNDIFHVDGLMSDSEPKRHDIADVPGHVFGHFIQTACWDVDAS